MTHSRRSGVYVIAAATLSVAACTGQIGSPGETSRAGGAAPGVPGGTTGPQGTGVRSQLCGTGSTVPGPAPLAHLTSTQYGKTLHDLFPSVSFGADVVTLPAEISTEGFTNNAATQTPSADLIEDLSSNAHAIATAAVEVPAKILPCNPASATEETDCGHQFVSTFGKRAFRRPLLGDEVQRYDAFFDTSYKQWGFQAALRLVIEGMLQAPSFLYRVEIGGSSAAGPIALTAHEMASRLSYFLTNSMPDDALLQAADRGDLVDAASLEREARRLLKSPGAREAVASFHGQWLRFDKMDSLSKAPDLYPTFSPATATAMKDATARYVDHLFWDEGFTLPTLLTDGHAYVNDVLAPLYGATAPKGAELGWLAVDAAQRSGILTQAGLLAGFAHQRNDAPVLRGVFVMDRLLCAAPPAPPPNVNTALPELKADAKLTTRQQLEQSHVATACANCHESIDGIGFGFESYDAVGAFRTSELGLPVDPTGNLKGSDVDGVFHGAVELGQKLAQSEQVRECVSTQWLRYALGVTREEIEGCMVSPIAKSFADSGYDLRELLVTTTKSDAFRYRPVE
jgi:Protein of unknown function (DUF1592)/Protein of unknown function (DUF1588)/Protein of unknown function (DUF1595)/Protein of unknown function (DUF1585)/Protein of unknown function (DUF1587)